MSLKDLVKYISAQETAISKLSVLDPKGNDCAEWIPFRNHLWGKPPNTFLVEEEAVERDNEPIKAVPIDPPLRRSVANLPPTISVALNIRSQKILVRSEYKEAEEAALSTIKSNLQVFVVCGQPGIGLFLSPPSLA